MEYFYFSTEEFPFVKLRMYYGQTPPVPWRCKKTLLNVKTYWELSKTVKDIRRHELGLVIEDICWDVLPN